MRLLENAFASRVPGSNAVIHARTSPSARAAQPFGIAGYSPVTVHLHDAAELAVRRGVEIMLNRPDRNSRSKGLVALLVLALVELGLPEATLQIRKEVWNGLGVVPNMGAGTAATPARVGATFPAPEAPVTWRIAPWAISEWSNSPPRLQPPRREGSCRRTSRLKTEVFSYRSS